jgi:purine-cytosine permease-like protein
MYTIGLGAALFAGTSDISLILMKAGLPIAALIIVLFSTVTTTFLDVYSAAISFKILKKIDEKIISIFICILGMLLAIFVPTSGYEKFLYLIGSAFSPLFAILLTDYYILKRNHASKQLDIQNAIIWCLGVIIYRLMTHLNTNLGSTLPTFISVMCVAWLVDQIKNKKGASR